PLRARRAALGRANHARSERQSLPLRRLPAPPAGGAHGPRPMITRLEGADKVTGRARYAADVRLPGLLHAHIVRSPYPHARIRHIDASRAERLPGVHAVLSSANSPSIPWHDASSLFDRTVRYIGDEVAAVAADSDELAADAARLIDVQYEALAFDLVGEAREPKAEARGDVARGLREADVVLEATYRTQTALHNALEPHGCTALWHGDQLTVYESTQGIFAVRDEVAEKLGLAAQNVRIITEHMGGGFGAKQIAWKHTVIAALLAQRTGRPVQLALDRASENLAAGNRNATEQRLRLGAKRDGTLSAIDARIRLEAGASRVGGGDSDATSARDSASPRTTGPPVAAGRPRKRRSRSRTALRASSSACRTSAPARARRSRSSLPPSSASASNACKSSSATRSPGSTARRVPAAPRWRRSDRSCKRPRASRKRADTGARRAA